VPHLVTVWGESFYMPLDEHLAIFRYKDRPGMIGRVGTVFGRHGVNIVSAAVGREANPDQAVMALTTDDKVPDEVIEEIVSMADFEVGRAVDL
jgi:D-3-phosphoglycerate dehydrogenase / 2-oxoglutarate reductase